MCNHSAAELIARLKRAYPAYEPSEMGNACDGIPKAGTRFQHRHKSHMVTVITATEKDVSYRKACGKVGWMGLREFLRLHNEVLV
ncbi:hypothetical protein [Klebsiella variicola]|uniref:hypothetical protein n=1 Tax=Klebsiella variicola TaxID=244366 RepID=UPI002B05D7E0|nr:hypothetical protein [Klebsiella variicola]